MIKRGRFQNVFDLADEIGPWDERLVAPPYADPQVYMSRSAGPQPFFLICAKDTLVMQCSGTADVQLRHVGTRSTRLQIGDILYIPAGTPSRIEPREEAIHLRFKAIDPGLEAVAWFCASCEAEIWRYEFDAGSLPVQQGYVAGCRAFNAEVSHRTCGSCQAVHPQVDITRYDWARAI
ncbi:hypothetical protein FAF44_49915 [Nonomuraea sp. MG754425]|uniref:hypothetical protein n=1 Tax=Nonomuraea sp. MG754425 TaxID=2570319 RepID=UPI001F3E5C77|nr:hypothetical protein [Nonomuraea sp. MG754425]MCF6476405.1 hypothetical protein [Nonomuraea sp. MG754425]